MHLIKYLKVISNGKVFNILLSWQLSATIRITYKEEVGQLIFSAHENCKLEQGAYPEVLCCYGEYINFLVDMLNENNSGLEFIYLIPHRCFNSLL